MTEFPLQTLYNCRPQRAGMTSMIVPCPSDSALMTLLPIVYLLILVLIIYFHSSESGVPVPMTRGSTPERVLWYFGWSTLVL